MEIYILRDNQEFGPYSREAALEYIKQGIFEAVDQACYAGMTEWKPVGELLGIDADSKPGRGAARGSAGKIAEFNPTWVHSNSTPRRRSRGGGIKSGLMIVLNVVLISILAMAAYIRWGGGSRMARHWLAAMSVELATLANAGLDNNATPAPVAGAPVIVKVPVAAASSPGAAALNPLAAVMPGAAPAAGSTPVSVAASTPALAASPDGASTPALAAASAVSPQPATTEDVSASPSPMAAQASAPALVAAAASPAPVVEPAPSPGTAIASASAPASEPDAAPSPNPAPASPPPDAAVLSPAAAAASHPAPPKPFDPADLAGIPSAWPKTLLLRQALTFPLLDNNSQVVGSVTEPTGTAVKLVNIQGDQLTLEYNGMRQTISWKQTDLAEEVAKIGSLAPPAQSVTGAPTAAAPSIAPATTPPSVAPAGSDAGTPAGN